MMMVEGRFQAAFLGAKLLAAKSLDNPIIDLSQSIGGAIFGNRDDEVAGRERLLRALDRLDAPGLKRFQDGMAGPVFRHLWASQTVRADNDLKSRLEVLERVVATGAAPAVPRSPAPVASAAIDASLFCSLNCRTRSLGEK